MGRRYSVGNVEGTGGELRWCIFKEVECFPGGGGCSSRGLVVSSRNIVLPGMHAWVGCVARGFCSLGVPGRCFAVAVRVDFPAMCFALRSRVG